MTREAFMDFDDTKCTKRCEHEDVKVDVRRCKLTDGHDGNHAP